MLAKSAALRALIAVEVRDAEPLERHIQLCALCCNESGNGRSHFGADSQTATTAVLEVIGLFASDFLAAFCYIEVKTFNHRAVIFVEGGQLKRVSDLSEEPVAELHVVGVKVSCALIGLCR